MEIIKPGSQLILIDRFNEVRKCLVIDYDCLIIRVQPQRNFKGLLKKQKVENYKLSEFEKIETIKPNIYLGVLKYNDYRL